MTDAHLDHLVCALPDLAAGVAEFAERTGVTPVAGGSHPGGTANYLVGFGPATHLEIIGPDPAAVRPVPFLIDWGATAHPAAASNAGAIGLYESLGSGCGVRRPSSRCAARTGAGPLPADFFWI